MIVGKKASGTSEMVVMIYRLLLVAVIAVIILGISSVFYYHYISVRTSEAILVDRQVVDCLAPEGIVDISLGKDGGFDLFSYCGINGGNLDRFFVNVSVRDSDGNEVWKTQQGDSGSVWVEKFFKTVEAESLSAVKLSEPGSYSYMYYAVLAENGVIKGKGDLMMEVVVRDDR